MDGSTEPLRGRSHAGGEHRRRRVRVSSVQQLRRAREGAEKGNRGRSSLRWRRGERRARGGAGDDGRSPAISVARGGRRRRGRRSEASGVTWVGGDEEEGAAVLLEASARRGVAGGRGEQRRWRRLRSAREGERNRGGGELGRE